MRTRTRRRSVRWLLGRACALVCALWLATIVQPQELSDRVIEHRLPNGMQFLYVVRHQAPVFSAVIRFRVGGVDEVTGRTGLAHLMEHMAFKGTRVVGTRDYAKEKPLLEAMDSVARRLRDELVKNGGADDLVTRLLRARLKELQQRHHKLVVKDEYDEIYSRNGGTGLNASTSQDVTTYYLSLPSNRLELWALMESQRIASPVFREFYAERDVVQEERRWRYENRGGGKLYESLITAAYSAHPYGLPVIGWMSDLQNLLRPDGYDFCRRYYTPGNAVAALVGDLDIDTTKRLVEKYFGAIPPGPPPPPLVTREPEQAGERRVVVEFPANPQVMIAYHKPVFPDPDADVFDVIDSVLSSGRSSRLHTELVKKKRLAVGVGTYSVPGDRYPNLFVIHAIPMQPHTTQELEQAVYAELDRLKTEPVTDHELQKVRNEIQAGLVRSLGSNSGLARMLTYVAAIAGDWRELLRGAERVQRVTAKDVQRVAGKYFTARNRTVATLTPPAREGTP